MLILIENTPRTYAWGSLDALPDLLGVEPTGEPQAELWLGTHPANPAHVAKASAGASTLIDLVEDDPERYGVNGGPLPFLMKVLAIGAPLSLQVHPDLAQAAAGFAAEDAAGIPRDAPHRNYGDANHKPELLVALSRVTALSGFRPVADAQADLVALAAAARKANAEAAAAALEEAVLRLNGRDREAVRRGFLEWAFTGDGTVTAALEGIAAAVGEGAAGGAEIDADADRVRAIRELVRTHPGDPGVLVSLLLHLVLLGPGEAIYLRARQLHAYLSGIAVEVMASSDNVLRAGLTEKHVDISELCRVVDTRELADPRFPCERVANGLVAWRPDVPDFTLLRARLCDPETEGVRLPSGSAPEVEVGAEHPLVLVVTAGRVRVERSAEEEGGLAEVATARRGQSLYVSAGAPVCLTGHGEVFLATVGAPSDDPARVH